MNSSSSEPRYVFMPSSNSVALGGAAGLSQFVSTGGVLPQRLLNPSLLGCANPSGAATARVVTFPTVAAAGGNGIILAAPALRPKELVNLTTVDSSTADMNIVLQNAALSNPVIPHKYKTQLCRNWMQSGTCTYEGNCSYAHGQDELRRQHESLNLLTAPNRNSTTSTSTTATSQLTQDPLMIQDCPISSSTSAVGLSTASNSSSSSNYSCGSDVENLRPNINKDTILEVVFDRINKLEKSQAELLQCVLHLIAELQKRESCAGIFDEDPYLKGLAEQLKECNFDTPLLDPALELPVDQDMAELPNANMLNFNEI